MALIRRLDRDPARYERYTRGKNKPPIIVAPEVVTRKESTRGGGSRARVDQIVFTYHARLLLPPPTQRKLFLIGQPSFLDLGLIPPVRQ